MCDNIIMTEQQKLRKKEYEKKYYLKNKKRLKAKMKSWAKANHEERLEYRRNWDKQKRANDPLYKLKRNLRSRLYNALVRDRNKTYKTKKQSTEEILGCSYAEFKSYIESQFTEGMDFYNIHVDHHIPLSSAKNEQELIDLCHYTNCKPMFAVDNIRKGSTILS